MDTSGARASRLWPESLVAAAVLILYAKELFTGANVVARDIGPYILPFKLWWSREISEGRIPQWLPGVGLGVPYLADPSNQTFYPPNLLLAFAMPHTLDLFLVAHLVAAGVGAVRLAQRLGADAHGSAVGGLVYALGGYMVSMTTSSVYLCGPTYLPWVILAVHRIEETRFDRRRVGLLGLLLTMQILSGDLQAVIFSSASALLFRLVAPVHVPVNPERAAGWKGWATLATQLFAAIVLATLLSAVQWLPASFYAAVSERADGIDITAAEVFSTHPMRLVNAFIANAWGNPVLGPYYGGSFESGSKNLPWALSLYCGAALPALAPLALFSRQRATFAATALAVLALSFSLGRHLPVHAFLRSTIPLLDMFRFPEKAFSVVSLMVALLAALGVRYGLERQGQRHLAPAFVATAALLAASAYGQLALAPGLPDAVGTEVRQAMANLAHQGLVAAGACLGLSLALIARRAWLVIAVCALDLGVAATAVQVPAHVAATHVDPRILELKRQPNEPLRIYDVRGFFHGLPPEAQEQLYIQTAKPNRGLVDGVHHLAAYTASGSRHGAGLVRMLDRIPSRLARVGSASGILTDEARWSAGAFPGMPLRARWGPIVLLENPTALPRAYVLFRALSAADEGAAFALLDDPRVALDRIAVFVGKAPPALPIVGAGETPPAPKPCHMDRFLPDEVAFSCTLSAPGVAVLADQVAPGWTLHVDDKPAPIERVQVAYRGAMLAPGTHRLVYRYLTPGLLMGLCMTALGLVALVGAWWRSGHASRLARA